jgi:ribosome-associated heat shock protein Hsp15
MRIDLALHALRLFKSRSQAQAAVADGRVLLNGARVKPSHDVAAGDRLTFTGESHTRTIEVLELPARSLSKEAAKAYVREVAGG